MDFIRLSQPFKVTAGTDRRIYFAPADSSEIWKLRKLVYLPNATLAANDTNYTSVRPYKGTSTTLALARETTTAGGAFTQGTAEQVALTAVGSDLEITRANPLSIRADESNGTGGGPDLLVAAEFEIIRS